MSIEIQAASEPSDIIWENRENTPAQRRFREIVTVIIIGISLALAATVIFLGRRQQFNYVKKYPKFPCQPFYDSYGAKLEGFAAGEYEYNL